MKHRLVSGDAGRGHLRVKRAPESQESTQRREHPASTKNVWAGFCSHFPDLRSIIVRGFSK